MCSRRNSVGVRSTLSPSTNAWTTRRVDPQLLDLDRVAALDAIDGRAPRRAAARTRATSSSIENGFTT